MRPYPETKNTKHHPRRQLPLKMGLNQSQNSSWMKVSLKKTHNSIIQQQQVKFRIFSFVEEYCCGLMTVMLLELLGRQRNQQKKTVIFTSPVHTVFQHGASFLNHIPSFYPVFFIDMLFSNN